MDDPCRMLIDSYHQAETAGDAYSRFFSMTTLDETGRAVSRTLTLREISQDGIVVYLNRESPKVAHLARHPDYELLFFWPSLLRQFRVRGGYEIFDDQAQRRSWQTKTHAGKLYDLFHVHASAQSSRLASREAYLRMAAQLRERFPETGELEMPREMACIRFVPEMIEIWYGSMQDHLHDRRLFQKQADGAWSEQVLVP